MGGCKVRTGTGERQMGHLHAALSTTDSAGYVE